jgi:NADH-quinone oxidoreductase subunit M
MSTLALIIILPFLAALLLTFVPRNYRFVMRLVALATTLLVAILGLILFWRFDTGTAGYQFVKTIPWLGAGALGITCRVGVDGVNIRLILMGVIVAFAAVCVSWEIKSNEKEFYILLLVMTGGVLGAFASLDLFFFYFFHELALVPTFIMIGVWGRGERKNYATFQITLYLSLGALIALVGLIALYAQSGANTFDIPKLTSYLRQNPLSAREQTFIFPFLLFGFGVLVSLWPFHTWAPLSYGSAPTATAMLHAPDERLTSSASYCRRCSGGVCPDRLRRRHDRLVRRRHGAGHQIGRWQRCDHELTHEQVVVAVGIFVDRVARIGLHDQVY